MSLAIRDGTWRVAVGDVKVLGRTQAAESSLKGYIVELTDLQDEFELSQLPEAEVQADGREIFAQVLRTAFGDVIADVHASNMTVAATGPSDSGGHTQGEMDQKDWRLAKLYMSVLRAMR